MSQEKSVSSSGAIESSGRLFVLDLSGGHVLAMDPDGKNKTVIATGCRNPDGVAIDAECGHVYWTNMGVPNLDDGTIERADLDGENRQKVVPQGHTYTPKQLHLDKANRRLYWSDREGMRVMRCNLDGSNIETLVDTSDGDTTRRDQTKWCVGIAIDHAAGHIYWTQKGGDNAGDGRIFRAEIDIPKGENPTRRSDIEVYVDGLPEPIDLEIDPTTRMLYWTDRGDPPRGNTVNRIALDRAPDEPHIPEIIMTHLMEGIGLALDLANRRMFITDFGGSVYSANLDGSNPNTLLYAQGNLTGVAYAEIPTKE